MDRLAEVSPMGRNELGERLTFLANRLRRKPVDSEEQAWLTQQQGGDRITDAAKQLAGVPGFQFSPEKDPNDFLSPIVKTFIKTLTTPEGGDLLRLASVFLFFPSFLERQPAFGSILSVALDLADLVGRNFLKTFQKAIPPLVGLLPLPYAQMVGMGMASLVGLFAWPLVALVSFSRQNFADAIDAMLRVVPLPIGEMLADGFSQLNRSAGRINMRREKFLDDVFTGLQTLRGLFGTVAPPDVAAQFQTGTQTIQSSLDRMRRMPESPLEALRAKATPPMGRVEELQQALADAKERGPLPDLQQQLSKNPPSIPKWTTQQLSERFSGAGLR